MLQVPCQILFRLQLQMMKMDSLHPLDDGAFLATHMTLIEISQVIFKYVCSLVSSSMCLKVRYHFVMEEIGFHPWPNAISSSSTLKKRPNLNMKRRRILFIFIRNWCVIAGCNWYLYFAYELVVNDWFCACCMCLEIKVFDGMDDDGSKLILLPCLIFYVVEFHNTHSVQCFVPREMLFCS